MISRSTRNKEGTLTSGEDNFFRLTNFIRIKRINESALHKLIKEVVNEILTQNTYQVSFTFYIALGEDRISYQKSIKSKDKLLDILDTIKEVVDYDVENDGED